MRGMEHPWISAFIFSYMISGMYLTGIQFNVFNRKGVRVRKGFVRSYRQQHTPHEGSDSNSCPLFYPLIALFSLWLPSAIISPFFSPYSPNCLQYGCLLSFLLPFNSYIEVNPSFSPLFIQHVISHFALPLFPHTADLVHQSLRSTCVPGAQL